jgi:predicted DsbA family dithiol-disulfide isomerase
MSTDNDPPFHPTDAHRRTLIVVSDVICPWCYIAKRRLDDALLLLEGREVELRVVWRPFQLNPDMPAEGMDRREYRTAKYGWEKSLALDARVRSEGESVGLKFRQDLIQRAPNTLDAHVLIAAAENVGGARLQDHVVEMLFSAYFEQGLDVGDRLILADLAEKASVPLATAFEDAALRRRVIQEERAARTAGFDGVPAFVLNGRYLFSGAQPVEVFVGALTDEHARSASAGERS